LPRWAPWLPRKTAPRAFDGLAMMKEFAVDLPDVSSCRPKASCRRPPATFCMGLFSIFLGWGPKRRCVLRESCLSRTRRRGLRCSVKLRATSMKMAILLLPCRYDRLSGRAWGISKYSLALLRGISLESACARPGATKLGLDEAICHTANRLSSIPQDEGYCLNPSTHEAGTGPG